MKPITSRWLFEPVKQLVLCNQTICLPGINSSDMQHGCDVLSEIYCGPRFRRPRPRHDGRQSRFTQKPPIDPCKLVSYVTSKSSNTPSMSRTFHGLDWHELTSTNVFNSIEDGGSGSASQKSTKTIYLSINDFVEYNIVTVAGGKVSQELRMVNSCLANLLLDAAKIASIVPRESRHLSKRLHQAFEV